MMAAPASAQALGTLRDLHAASRTPEALALYLEAIRRILGADAVQLLGYLEGAKGKVLAEAAPSAEISANLIATAGDLRAAADGARVVISKYRFGGQLVHLVAAATEEEGEWLLTWLRLPEGAPPDAVAGIVELAILALPRYETGGATALPQAPRLPEVPQLPQLPRVDARLAVHERLARFARWFLSEVGAGAQEVVLFQRGLFGWKMVAAADRLPPRTGALAQAMLHVVRGSSEQIALDEVQRLSGHKQARCYRFPSADETGQSGSTFAIVATGDRLKEKPEAALAIGQWLLPLLAPPSGLGQWWQAKARGRRQLYGWAAVAILAILAFPVHHRVRPTLILEPAVRRFVSAPFDGVLKKVHVRAGDVVEKGQVLIELDEREISERLADVEARLSSAILQNTTELEMSNYGEAAVRALDAASLTHEQKLLKDRKENLHILSPVDGVVVTGEVERSVGATVELGKALLEIAPLETLLVELAVEEADVSLVEAGQHVKMQLFALPGKVFRGVIGQVSPRSETRDSRNIFVAHVELENTEAALRPGMKGRAVIFGPRKPLGLVLTRKPWQLAQRFFFR